MASFEHVPVPRKNRLKAWMAERYITFFAIGERLEITAQRARAALNAEAISSESWINFVN